MPGRLILLVVSKGRRDLLKTSQELSSIFLLCPAFKWLQDCWKIIARLLQDYGRITATQITLRQVPPSNIFQSGIDLGLCHRFLPLHAHSRCIFVDRWLVSFHFLGDISDYPPQNQICVESRTCNIWFIQCGGGLTICIGKKLGLLRIMFVSTQRCSIVI